MAFKYNPGFLTNEESIKNFVVRHKDLQLIVDIVKQNTNASANRHVLIVGPRGSGKTTLVRRLVAEIRTDPQLAQSWYPIVLGEESYTITNAGEFWLECLFHLAEQTGRPDLEEQHRELIAEKDEVRLRERALGLLRSFAIHEHKRLAVVVENLNMIFDEQMSADEAWTIRHALQNTNELMLIATATKKFEQIQKVDRALYEQFKVHELRPLTLTDISSLWARFTTTRIRSAKARPIQILTGGSPRLVTILAEFAADHSFQNLLVRLTTLIDQYTDYFKSQLDSLAPAERKVFVSVLEKWDPSTTREIADEARVPVNIASANLNRLKSKGAIHKRITDGVQYWEATERLFNLYYLMRRRGAPSSRVYALVKFMTIYYEQDQLPEIAADLANECRTLAPGNRQDHYSALSQIMGRFDPSQRQDLLKLVPSDFTETTFANQSKRLSKSSTGTDAVKALGSRIMELLKNDAIEEALKQLENAPSGPLMAPIWALTGLHFGLEKQDYETAHRHLVQAAQLNPKSTVVVYFTGLVYNAEGRYADAVGAFRQAISMGRDDSDVWASLGKTYELTQELAEAEAAFRKAVEKDERNADAWFELGILFNTPPNKRLEEAEVAFRKATELAPDRTRFAGTLGTFLFKERSDFVAADGFFKQVLERKPAEGRAWASMIQLRDRSQALPAEIDALYEKAIATPELVNADQIYSAFADHLNRIHEHARAETVLRSATLSYPTSSAAWFNLACQIAYSTEKQQEALDAFNKALELAPEDADYWTTFGEFLSGTTEQWSEAEKALRKAVALAPKDCKSWRALGDHLAKTTRTGEAEECFQRAIAINSKCVCSIEGYASVLAKGAGFDAIKDMIDGFILRMPTNPYPHIALAEYLDSLQKDKKGAVTELMTAVRKGANPLPLVDRFLDLLDYQDSSSVVSNIRDLINASKERVDPRNAIAWRLFKKEVNHDLVEFALSISKEAVRARPEVWASRHTLAGLLIKIRDVGSALKEIAWLAERVNENELKDFIDLCVIGARLGLTDEIEALLRAAPTKAMYEPLLVALRLGSGQDTNVALEVLEVAKDIRRQITGEAELKLSD